MIGKKFILNYTFFYFKIYTKEENMAEKFEKNVANKPKTNATENPDVTIAKLKEQISSIANTAQIALNQNKALREVIKNLSNLL